VNVQRQHGKEYWATCAFFFFYAHSKKQHNNSKTNHLPSGNGGWFAKLSQMAQSTASYGLPFAVVAIVLLQAPCGFSALR